MRTHIEVRPLFELDDFGPSEAIDRMRAMDAQLATSGPAAANAAQPDH